MPAVPGTVPGPVGAAAAGPFVQVPCASTTATAVDGARDVRPWTVRLVRDVT